MTALDALNHQARQQARAAAGPPAPPQHVCAEDGHSWVVIRTQGDMTLLRCRYCRLEDVT